MQALFCFLFCLVLSLNAVILKSRQRVEVKEAVISSDSRGVEAAPLLLTLALLLDSI